MEKLTKVILEYVYTAPFIIKQAEKALKKVDGKKKKAPDGIIVSTIMNARFPVPMKRKVVKDVPLGDFEEISILMPQWATRFFALVANKRLIKFNLLNMPTLGQDIRNALNQKGYRELILQDDHDQHFLIPKDG